MFKKANTKPKANEKPLNKRLPITLSYIYYYRDLLLFLSKKICKGMYSLFFLLILVLLTFFKNLLHNSTFSHSIETFLKSRILFSLINNKPTSYLNIILPLYLDRDPKKIQVSALLLSLFG